MVDQLVPPMPPEVPTRGNWFSKAVGRRILRTMGWRMTGVFPSESKAICAVGPHTSNWDFIIGAAAILACGLDVRYLMKKEAFVWPFSTLFVWLGGEPLDRRASANTVDQIVEHYLQAQNLWVAIAPEGTRRKVTYWRNGFLRIAHTAGIPVVLIGFDYANKELVIDKLWSATENYDLDAAEIRDYMRQRFVGRHPSQQ